MDLNAWASISSAVGTVVAAAVAAYSARLAWRQVRYQFEPRLSIPPRDYQIKMAAGSLKDLFWEKPTDAAAYVNGGSTDYHFALRNIGNGAAYNISIRVELDFEVLYTDTKNKIERYAPGLIWEHDDFGAQIKIDGKSIGGFRFPNESAFHMDYLGVGEDGVRNFRIDSSLSFFALCYGHYLMHEQIDRSVSQPEQRIDFSFVVEYTDSSANLHKIRCPSRLTIRGGRWLGDLSDGLAIISLSSR